MSGAGGDNKRELLARHGLEGATWLETVDHYMYDDPALYRALLSDPPALQGQISSWDLAFYTGARSDYARGRGWSWWMAVRELVQNALDASEEAYGRAKMHASITTDELGLHIINLGPRLPIMAWMFGGSTKECWERGQFGEGLKMAAIYYAGIGRPLYIFNKSEVYKAIVSPTSGVVYVVVGTAARELNGTDAIVMDPETMANAKMISDSVFTNISSDKVLSWVEWNPSECPYLKPSFAIDMPDILYVRDIYVNRISNITNRPSVLGYNLWWVELDPNRTTVAAVRSQKWAQPLDWNVVLTWTPKVVRVLLDRLIALVGPGTYQVLDKYYESHIDLDFAPVTKNVVEAAGEWLKQHNIEAVAELGPSVESLRYLAGVKTLLLAPPGFLGLFPKEMQLDHLYTERYLKNALNAPRTAIPEGSMTLRQRGALNAVRGYYLYLVYMMFMKRMPAVFLVPSGALGEGTDGMCNSADHTVMIDVRVIGNLADLMRTAAHEFAHCMSVTAKDVTSEFEANLSKVAGNTNSMYLSRRLEALAFMDASYRYGGGGKIMEYRYFSEWWKSIRISITHAMTEALTAAGFSGRAQGAVLNELLKDFQLSTSSEGLPSVAAVKIYYNPKLDAAPLIEDISRYYTPPVPLDSMPSSWEPRAREFAGRSMRNLDRPKYGLVVVLVYDPVNDGYRVMADTINEYKADVAAG